MSGEKESRKISLKALKRRHFSGNIPVKLSNQRIELIVAEFDRRGRQQQQLQQEGAAASQIDEAEWERQLSR